MTDSIDQATQSELEAAAFRRLMKHLQTYKSVQNVDLMGLAGFCRNCLADWYRDAAGEKGIDISKDEAREAIYGMPYSEWKDKYQSEATPEQIARMDAFKKRTHG